MGYYYAVVALDAAGTFKAMPGKMFVNYTEVPSLPRKPQQPATAAPIVGLLNSPNPQVRDAAGRYVATVLDSLTDSLRGRYGK